MDTLLFVFYMLLKYSFLFSLSLVGFLLKTGIQESKQLNRGSKELESKTLCFLNLPCLC